MSFMEKLLGILPYLYFFDEPIRLGSVILLSLPDTKGRDFAPKEDIDRVYLQELVQCFPSSRGLESDKGVIRAFTYFLIDNPDMDNAHVHVEARKAITLLRYMMLRPDSQGLGDLETSAIYTFELPPAGSHDNRVYHGWVNFNQEEWITPNYQKFHPPGWYVDCQIKHTSILEDLDSIVQQFYNNVVDERVEAEVILAMEWYNLSFSKYAFRGIAGQLVDIATAFETLFQLPRYKKTAGFVKRIRESLNIEQDSVLDDWAKSFYSGVRSETVHSGKPLSYIFKHPDAQAPHLNFLWSAQRIFRECLAAKAGLGRKIDNHHLIEELTPNEVVLKELRALGSYENIKSKSLEIWKLRQLYPVGDREDIIWLGNTLLSEMTQRISKKHLPNLASIIDSILGSDPDDNTLWSKYVQLDKELSDILFRGDTEKAKQLSECIQLAYEAAKFASFAWYALQLVAYIKKQ
jgi:hypothetical protein